jgi:hypothetical protein
VRQRSADGFRNQWGNRVSDLPETMGWFTRKPKPIWKSLETSGLPNGKGPMLLRVDVPVAILCDVRGDGSTQMPPGQTFVFVRKDVTSVPAQFVW